MGHLCCAHLSVCLHHPSVTCHTRCIGSSGRILASAGKDGRYDGSAPDAPRTLQCYSYPMRLPAPARVATYIQPPASDCVRSIGSSGPVVSSAGWQGDGGGGDLSWYRCTQHLCCAHLCVCLHHLSVTCRVRSIGSSGPVISSAGKDGRYDGIAPDAPRTLQCYSYPMHLPAPA